MNSSIVEYRDWTFVVDKQATEETYARVLTSGADTCLCYNCENYVAFRERIFPDEVVLLFQELGIDFKKEVEIVDWGRLSNGFHVISGWFHFKGELLTGKNCRSYFNTEGYTLDLTPINDCFSIGFSEGNDLTYFREKTGLVQVEFNTRIPWVISKTLEDI